MTQLHTAAPSYCLSPAAEAAPVVAAGVLADHAAICALEHACFTRSERYCPGTWRWFLGEGQRKGRAIVLVARWPDGRPGIAGFCLGRCSPGKRIARIAMLAVSPEARGMGVGTTLLAALGERFPAHCDVFTLEVRNDNQRAQELYQRLGFAPFAPASAHLSGSDAAWSWRAWRSVMLAGCRRAMHAKPALTARAVG